MTIFKHVMLRVILQVRDRDDMSTLQLRLHTHSLMHLPKWFPIVFPMVSVLLSVILLWQVLPNCSGFPLTSLSLANSQLLTQTPHVWLARCYRVIRTT